LLFITTLYTLVSGPLGDTIDRFGLYTLVSGPLGDTIDRFG